MDAQTPDQKIINWLLDGDVSIQYMTHKLLMNSDMGVLNELQRRIETEGYGARFLSCRNDNGHWGYWFYQPKWTSTHYTLADLKNIGMPGSCIPCREMIMRAFNECMLDNGGINFAKTMVQSDVCIDGMILDYASYFCPDERRIPSLTDFILSASKPDGGYSWDMQSDRSDPHTTIAVLEGFHTYHKAGFTDHRDAVLNSEKRALEYLLSNGLFMSGDKRYRMLSYPYRYRYDLLRVLEYFADADISYDQRMRPALEWLKNKQKDDNRWCLENIHHGKVHFDMETKRQPSRFITLKAMHILNHYRNHDGPE